MTFKGSTLKVRAVTQSDKHFGSIIRFFCPLPALRSHQSICTYSQRFPWRPAAIWRRVNTWKNTTTDSHLLPRYNLYCYFLLVRVQNRFTSLDLVKHCHTSTSRGTHWGRRRDARPQEVTKLAARPSVLFDLPSHRTSHCGETGSRESGWDRWEGKQEQRPRPHFPAGDKFTVKCWM